jgi:hypothetical protein
MRYLVTRGQRVLCDYKKVEDAYLEVGKWLATLNLLGVVGVELVVWKEWATGKRQKVKAFYTTPQKEDEK